MLAEPAERRGHLRPTTRSLGGWLRRGALLLGLPLAGCGGAAESSHEPATGEIDLSSPDAQRADPLAGLVPCRRDASLGCARALGSNPRPAPAPAGSAGHPAAEADDRRPWRVELSPDDPRLGPDDAKVTLVVFSDFECPFCRRMAQLLAEARRRHPSLLRVVWKDAPLPQHAQAENAALLARFALERAGATGFWSMHDHLFAEQAQLGEPTFRRLVEAAGLPWADARESLRTRRLAMPLYRALQLGRRLGVTMTPTTFVNGYKLAGIPTEGTLERAIALGSADAERVLASGVPPRRVYERLVGAGRQLEVLDDL